MGRGRPGDPRGEAVSGEEHQYLRKLFPLVRLGGRFCSVLPEVPGGKPSPQEAGRTHALPEQNLPQ